MTPLSRLRELHEKATAGPWGSAFDGDVHRIGPRECDVCIVEGAQGAEEDAALIVEMRNALPAMLDALEAAEALAEAVGSSAMQCYDDDNENHYDECGCSEHVQARAAAVATTGVS